MRLTQTQLTRIIESQVYQDLVEKKFISFDSSFFSDVDGCDVQALLGGVLKLVANRNETALVFGSAYHEALAHHYAFPGTPVEELVAIALKYWDANPTEEDSKRNRQSLESLVRAYIQEQLFGIDFKPLLVEEKPVVEKGFETTLATSDGYELRWKGKIDLIAKVNGKLWVVDHKTTSIMGEKFADDKYRSNQMLGYTFLARQVLGLRVEGVIINAAAFRKGGFEFQRFTLPISEHAVYEWAEEVAHKLDYLRKLLLSLHDHVEINGRYGNSEVEKQLPFVSTTRNLCVTKYGKCRFFDVCQAFVTQRDNLLFNSRDFKTSSFNPLSL